jgi:PKD repeat protein
MLVHNSASLRTGIVRLVVAAAVLVSALAITAVPASAHSSGHHHGHHWSSHVPHGHAWGWWFNHGWCIARKPIPTAAFTADPAATFVGDAVQLDATSSTGGTTKSIFGNTVTGTITKYDWSFGDGTSATSTTATTSHTYSEAGIFSVKLTVTNDAGKTAYATKSIVVSPLPVPVADFTVDPTVMLATRPLQFDASASTGGESNGRVGTIVSYDWDFGDATTGTGVSQTHAFADPNSYDVTLTVTNDAGKSNSVTKILEVAPMPKPIPTAAFSLTPGSPVAERNVVFDGGASTGGQTDYAVGTIVSYDWNFGDGGTASSAAPVTNHTFAASGTFTVSLTVTNDAGESNTSSRSVTVFPAPPPYDPGAEPTAALSGDPVVVNPLTAQRLVSSKSGTNVKVAVGFDLPAGSDTATACQGTANVAVSFAGLKKASGKSPLTARGSGCQLRFKLNLPKGYAGKKAKFAFSFAGNDSVAPWALTRKLAVK